MWQAIAQGDAALVLSSLLGVPCLKYLELAFAFF